MATTCFLRFLFVVFLHFLVTSESFAASSSNENLSKSGSEVAELEDFIKFWFNDSVALLSSAQEDTAEHCSDMNSKVSLVLKKIFARNTNLKETFKVRFYFSSRTQPRRVEIFTDEKIHLDRTDFNVERRTVLIVHGFLSGGSQSWIRKMEDAFLLWGDVNVVVIDWSTVGKSINYYRAAISTRIVGYEIARFLHAVVKATMERSSKGSPKWGKLHLVGHSLGSHISAVAAYDFRKMQNYWQVSRITGLDPALPCFNNVSNAYRLDRTDAAFVDVIHTSASVRSTVGFGNAKALGHVDFYPNGGKRQPGCSRVQGSIFKYIWVPLTPPWSYTVTLKRIVYSSKQQAVIQGTCSHARSYAYFTESLIQAVRKNCTFWAHKWDQTYAGAMRVIGKPCDTTSCTEMGIQAENHPHRGIFFVTTSQRPPFCVADQRSIKEIKRHLRIELLPKIG